MITNRQNVYASLIIMAGMYDSDSAGRNAV